MQASKCIRCRFVPTPDLAKARCLRIAKPCRAPVGFSRIVAAGTTAPFRTISTDGGAATNGSKAEPALTSAGPAAPAPRCLTPPQTYFKAVETGEYKAKQPVWKILMMGVYAGCYVAFGGFLALSIGGQCPGVAATNPGLQKMIFGAFGFPVGLMMVLTCGADLFTGNTCLVTTALYEGKITFKQLLKSWVFSYLGNFIGASLMVSAVIATGLLASPVASAAAVKVASMKVSMTFGQTFLKAVLANWLVNLAIWQSMAAQDFTGKFVGVWLPISAFAALGLEHSVANMFMIPVGMALGADITPAQFVINNLIPVTLGNILAGAVLVATYYSLCFGALGKKLGPSPA